MYPCLQEGDVLEYIVLASFGVGDIIIFYDGESKEITAHRCVRKEGDRIWVKGDRAIYFDNFISSHYLGKVVKVIRAEEEIHIANQWNQYLVAKLSWFSSDRYFKFIRYFAQGIIASLAFIHRKL